MVMILKRQLMRRWNWTCLSLLKTDVINLVVAQKLRMQPREDTFLRHQLTQNNWNQFAFVTGINKWTWQTMFANEQGEKKSNANWKFNWLTQMTAKAFRVLSVHTEVLYSVWLIWIKNIITPSLDDGDISLLRTEPSFARVRGRWRAGICEDRSFQVEQAACARKCRHHSPNVITFVQGQKPEHRLRRSRNTRNGNYNNAHVTQCKKTVENHTYCTYTQTHTHKTNAQMHSHVMPLLRAWRPNGTFKKKKQKTSQWLQARDRI